MTVISNYAGCLRGALAPLFLKGRRVGKDETGGRIIIALLDLSPIFEVKLGVPWATSSVG